MREVAVCMGCGKLVGDGDEGECTCPPPSLPRASGRTPPVSGPYRMPPEAPDCPRCSGRMKEAACGDLHVLECVDCRGFFLERHAIEILGTDEGKSLRLAFPRRPRVAEEPTVSYLPCPVCHSRMNRVNFAKISGVIVDVCKNDGVWFDAGEINAVIEFVEKGGLEIARKKIAAEHEATHRQLAQEFQKQHALAEQARMHHGHSAFYYGPSPELQIISFSIWQLFS